MARKRLPTDERKRQIVAAALQILATKGALYLTAAELGRAVGISDATIFRHFRDLDEVVLAAVAHIESMVGETFPPPGGDPLERLRAFFVHRLALVREKPEILMLVGSDRLEEVAGAEAAKRLRAVFARSREFLHRCVADAQASGAIPKTLDPTVLEWILRGTLQAAVMATARPRSNDLPGPEDVWRTLETLLRGAAR